MNVIFLDIDGVLNNRGHARRLNDAGHTGAGFGRPWELDVGNFSQANVGWDPANIEALLHITLNVECPRIVISSTWRMNRRVTFFRECFREFGEVPLIIGMTPILNNAIRGDEVNEWLDRRGTTHVDSWVCLDDDGDFHPENNLIQTDLDVGLTMENAEEAINILSNRGK